MTTSDSRHLDRMSQAIAAARTGKIGLTRLADELLFLRDALDSVDQDWANQLTIQIATLESAGLASAEQQAEMGDAYGKVVRETIDAVEQLISRLPRGGDSKSQGR